MVGRKDDTLWVRDGNHRLVLFTQQGKPAGLVRLRGSPAGGAPPESVGPRFPLGGAALLADGSVLAAPVTSMGPRTVGETRRESYVRVSRSGDVRDTLLTGIVADGGIALTVDPSRRQVRFLTGNPFGGGDLVGIRPDGSAIVVVRPRPRGESGEARVVSVTALGPSGVERWSREVRLRRHRDRGASFDRAVETVVEKQMRAHERQTPAGDPVEPDEEALSRGYREALEDALEHLPVSQLVVGSDGSILMERTLPRPDGRRLWLLLSASGEPVARVRMPSDVDVKDVRGGSIWGTTRGELGVEYVAELALPIDP